MELLPDNLVLEVLSHIEDPWVKTVKYWSNKYKALMTETVTMSFMFSYEDLLELKAPLEVLECKSLYGERLDTEKLICCVESFELYKDYFDRIAYKDPELVKTMFMMAYYNYMTERIIYAVVYACQHNYADYVDEFIRILFKEPWSASNFQEIACIMKVQQTIRNLFESACKK
jgi:hypothetical protein